MALAYLQEGRMGVEPITQRLTAACSAIELHPHSASHGIRTHNFLLKRQLLYH